jgi:two-component system LytT family response regulator
VTRPLRLLIVDDEPPARRRLRRMLSSEAEVDVIGECGSGAEAIEQIRTLGPDVVLLDVQMPGGDGFEVVEELGASALPLVVFVTAYDEYALRAFDAAALDYLVKPVRRPRLRTALARARERIAPHNAATAGGEVTAETPLRPERLLIDRGHHMEVLAVDDVDWIEAADNHVIVHVGKEAHRFRRTMEQVLERLPPDRFVRIHRSTIVNLNRVRQVHDWFNGYLLVLADGTRLPTGRQYRDAVMQRLHALR